MAFPPPHLFFCSPAVTIIYLHCYCKYVCSNQETIKSGWGTFSYTGSISPKLVTTVNSDKIACLKMTLGILKLVFD